MHEEGRALLEIADGKDRSPLHLAAYKGHHNLCKRILELAPAGHALEVDTDEKTALLHAVIRGHERCVQKLLDTEFGRCAVEHEDRDGLSALAHAKALLEKAKLDVEQAPEERRKHEAQRDIATYEAMQEIIESALLEYEHDPTIEEMEEMRGTVSSKKGSKNTAYTPSQSKQTPALEDAEPDPGASLGLVEGQADPESKPETAEG